MVDEGYKPCPICGGVTLEITLDRVDQLIGIRGDILCKTCGCKVSIDKWNTRYIESELQKLSDENKAKSKVILELVELVKYINDSGFVDADINFTIEDILKKLK